ncbi:hypothetical protein GIB67_013337 [Kingdonia uniflora]|uniref:Wax synthase domain-containing protein n=1 Tax=Kingdonia uniflora TaxID=39325 RepID=A0A7J7LQQ7_9MAGN|nr:hypothetical protein GIB67_013337 [Kingdonia uniflora]
MMGGEFENLIKVITTVILSLTYTYYLQSRIQKGYLRLILIIPVITIFFLLPLLLTSVHFGGTVGFFISWLANFKLLLFAFGQGPLCSHPSNSITLKEFIYLACLPIKIKQNPHQFDQNKTTPNHPINNLDPKKTEDSPHLAATNGHKSLLNYAIKVVLLVMMVRIYAYKDYIHPYVILLLYGIHVYFALEILLFMVAALARSVLGLELEPQFDDPYMATSLQDFWGRRWNLMVPSILRPTVYLPVRSVANRVLGKKWELLPAALATFIVSGLMHEVIFFYLGRVRPTWEVMWFFALHGVCLALEIEVKRALKGRWGLHPMVSRLLTMAFVMVTGIRLFFPQFLQCHADVRAIQEYAIFAEFMKESVHNWRHWKW